MANTLIAYQPQFDFQDTPLVWFDQSILKTVFINAFSDLIPQTEAFLILAVQEVKEKIKDPLLLQEIEVFLEQEKNHMVAHSAFNRYLEAMNFPTRAYIKAVQKYLAVYKKCSSEQKLELCVLMESITSSLCENYLQTFHQIKDNHYAPHQLLIWHSIEELDHRALAFRVHQALYRDYKPAYFRNAFFSIKTTWTVFKIMLSMLRVHHQLFRLRTWKDIFWLLGKEGPAYLSLKGYLNFIKKSYDPESCYAQDRGLIEMSNAYKTDYPLEAKTIPA